MNKFELLEELASIQDKLDNITITEESTDNQREICMLRRKHYRFMMKLLIQKLGGKEDDRHSF